MTVSRELARGVETRAMGRCEYCRMHQSLQGATFHIEHIIPRSRGGAMNLENLAWCCPSCNLNKSDRIEALDPTTQLAASLFHPRSENWVDHFLWNDFQLVGKTAIGRATVAALKLNHARRISVRKAEALFDLFPE